MRAVNPNRHWLPDASWTLDGIARFAEVYDDRFHRIEAYSRIDGKLWVLDLKLAEVRTNVLEHSDTRFSYNDADTRY